MEQKTKVRLVNDFFLILAQGTSGIQVARKLQLNAELEGHPLRHGVNAWFMGFDEHLAPSDDPSETNGRPDPMAAHHIEARLADRESRLALQAQGDLWWLTREQCERPGVRQDQSGTGGTPAWGRADLIMNLPRVHRCLEQGLRTYDSVRRKLRVVAKNGSAPQEDALPCFIFFSTVGGEGSGSFKHVCAELRRLAAQQGVKVKTILCPVDAGTSLPPNRFLALRNRMWALNTIRAEMTDRYREPGAHQDDTSEALFDMVLVCSNAGGHSQISSLAEQQALLAKVVVRMMCSLLGKRLQ